MDLNRPRRLAGWLGLIAPVLLTFLQPLTMNGATLKAGVASADITPPFGKYRVVTSGKIGVSARDSLYAKVLVLEDSQTRIAIVSLDLCYAFPPEMFDPYRQRLKREAGIDYVVLNASHTHKALRHWDAQAQTRSRSNPATTASAFCALIARMGRRLRS